MDYKNFRLPTLVTAIRAKPSEVLPTLRKHNALILIKKMCFYRPQLFYFESLIILLNTGSLNFILFFCQVFFGSNMAP
jgi:hypothetical protein